MRYLLGALLLCLIQSTVVAQEWSVPSYQSGIFVYTVPNTFDPPLIGRGGIKRLQTEMEELELPLSVVFVRSLNLSGTYTSTDAVNQLTTSWSSGDQEAQPILLVIYGPALQSRLWISDQLFLSSDIREQLMKETEHLFSSSETGQDPVARLVSIARTINSHQSPEIVFLSRREREVEQSVETRALEPGSELSPFVVMDEPMDLASHKDHPSIWQEKTLMISTSVCMILLLFLIISIRQRRRYRLLKMQFDLLIQEWKARVRHARERYENFFLDRDDVMRLKDDPDWDVCSLFTAVTSSVDKIYLHICAVEWWFDLVEQQARASTRRDTTLLANLIKDVNAIFLFDPSHLSHKNQARIVDSLNQHAKVYISTKYFLDTFRVQLDEAIEGWEKLHRIADTRPAGKIRYLPLPRQAD